MYGEVFLLFKLYIIMKNTSIMGGVPSSFEANERLQQENPKNLEKPVNKEVEAGEKYIRVMMKLAMLWDKATALEYEDLILSAWNDKKLISDILASAVLKHPELVGITKETDLKAFLDLVTSDNVALNWDLRRLVLCIAEKYSNLKKEEIDVLYSMSH